MKYYVGIKKPFKDRGYINLGSQVELPVILLNSDGEMIAGRPLNYRIYKGRDYWWWEYENFNEYRLRFKTDEETELIKEGNLISRNTPVILDFAPEDAGRYLIEVQDGEESGHVCAFLISAYPWGRVPLEGQDAGILVLKADKIRYHPGEEAKISFPVPKQGSVLLSVERGNDILYIRRFTLTGEQQDMEINIPVKENMAPTTYASISIIQPHKQTLNDRPIRMYGIVPLNIEDPSTRQKIDISMPDVLESEKEFSVEITNSVSQQTQFTIAIVDEGLLDLTNFSTPDPWKAFFKKLRLGIKTADLYAHVLGINKGDVFKTF